MVIPLIAIGIMSAIPFLLPSDKNKEQISQEVITQNGRNRFRRNGWRTNHKDIYSRPPISPQQKSGIDLKTIMLIAGIGLAGLMIVRKVL